MLNPIHVHLFVPFCSRKLAPSSYRWAETYRTMQVVPPSYRQVIGATFANFAIPNWGTYESLFSSLSDKSPIKSPINPHQSPYLVVITCYKSSLNLHLPIILTFSPCFPWFFLYVSLRFPAGDLPWQAVGHGPGGRLRSASGASRRRGAEGGGCADAGDAADGGKGYLFSFFLCFVCGRFCFFWGGSWFYAFLFSAFLASLLFCFSDFLPLCFFACLLFCFLFFLLHSFSAFCFPCFPASLLFLLLCFSAFLLFAFPALLLLCFPCFSAFVLLCLSTSTILRSFFFSRVFLLLYFLLLCFFASCLYGFFVFYFLLLHFFLFASQIKTYLERP